MAVLYVFGGLPGTGKTSLSVRLARDIEAVHLRIDTIEDALLKSGSVLRGTERLIRLELNADRPERAS